MNHSKVVVGVLVAVVAAAGCKKKDAEPAAGSAAPVGSAAVAPVPAPPPAPDAAPVAAAEPAPAQGGCPTGQIELPGPKLCIALPDGYAKPLKLSNVMDKTGGHIQMYYSTDGTSGGAFLASVQITYNAASTSPVNWDYFTKDSTDYCDEPAKMVPIGGGKGKYFTCASKKLGHTLSKSKLFTDKNAIDCDTQSDKRPDIDSLCKTITQQ